MTMPTPRTIAALLPHFAAVAVIVACIQLSLWQVDRAAEKEALLAAWDKAPAIELGPGNGRAPALFSEVIARGRFDPQRHILLDNQVRNQRSGVHVFTPFYPDDTDSIWMVNRGWFPYERDRGLTESLETPDSDLTVHGRISEPPRVGLEIGRATALDREEWPNLMTYFDIERIRDAFDENVADRVILLDPDHPAHLTGDAWQPVTFGPERHRAYAFQWAAMATAVAVIWLVLVVRKFWRK